MKGGTIDSDSDFEDNIQQNKGDQAIWTFKRKELQGVKFKVNFKMRDGITKTIKSVLKHFDGTCYKKFKRSCFGHFIKLPEVLNKCASAVHFFISREIEFGGGSDHSSELSFFVNSKIIRFSRYEYALVTGLMFGKSTFNPHDDIVIPENSLYRRLFNNRSITVDNLENEFVARRLGDDPEDYLKVSKILFVYNFLLGLESKTKTVADWMWVLVENNDEFESFPWGSYTYQHLLHYMKGIKRVLSNNGKTESYPMYGFSAAFLAWIYCAVPQLGKTCGVVLSERKTPRMLRFQYSRTNTNVTEITGEVHETLTPTREETETRYWQSIEPRDTEFLLSYKKKKLKSGISKISNPIGIAHGETTNEATIGETVRGGTIEARQDIDHGEKQRSGTTLRYTSGLGVTLEEQQAWIGEISENIHKRIRSDEQFINKIGESTLNVLKNDTSYIEEIGGYIAKRIRNEFSDFLPGYMEYMTHRHDTTGPYVQVERNPNLTTPIHDKDLQHFEIPDNDPIWSQSDAVAKAVISSGNDTIDPVLQQENIHKEISVYPKKIDFKTVRARAASALLSSPFCAYDKRGADYNKFLRPKTKRNVGIGTAVSSTFFKDMANIKKELLKTHIDAYLASLFTSPEYGGFRKYDKRVTITSTSFLPAVYEVFNKHHNPEEMSQFDPAAEEILSKEELHRLSRFVVGEQPEWGQIKPWQDYDKVIVVVHVIFHWVTCCINLKETCVTIYDPLQHNFDATDYMDSIQFFVPLARVLPQVLRYAGFYDARPDITPCLTQWKVEHPKIENIYKQVDNTNCGAFALKYVDALLTGECEEGFGKKELKNYRSRLAMTVYAFSTDEDTILS